MKYKKIIPLVFSALFLTACDPFGSDSSGDSGNERRSSGLSEEEKAEIARNNRRYAEAAMNGTLDELLRSEMRGTPPVGETHPSGTPPSTGAPSPINLSSVKFIHTNVSGWAQTATLSVRFSGNNIVLTNSKAKDWPGRDTAGAFVNANPWIFVNRNGQWYAATWEWMRVGQTSKSKRAVNGDHIKASPLNDFVPVSGETYGFMVSGLARTNVRNVNERSNIVMVRWP